MKYILSLFLLSFSLLLLIKGINLWSIMVHADGKGLAISFMGIDIVERVAKEAIPGYALGFTIAAVIPLFVFASMIFKPLLKGDKGTRESV
ncbi:hypothetical protein WQ57_11450 [Mesobacillus campisalis]|uniref:Uncharacterized protein n=1 Tax=Mesobacillus campisalis TaxID=1408103 RepID=A0A0M2SVQ7_9BACI|nr:hypothetical protein [Mesobacillus campisalis]KKK37786.1 hypothetical protein WQ57_11450 [Mesobacillus campisalis]